MIAIDTNVLARLLTQDEPGQTRRAIALQEANSLYVSKTVLLETEWVLRSFFKRDPETIHRLLTHFCGIETVIVEDEPIVQQALMAFADGMDFADAMHLFSTGPAHTFATFDRELRKRARKRRPGVHVIEP